MTDQSESADTVQGSEEWLQARCGWLGASSMSDVLAKGQGITRTKCLRRIVAELLTGKPMETYQNGHMERGNLQEPDARASYEAITGNLVEEVGFIKHGRNCLRTWARPRPTMIRCRTLSSSRATGWTMPCGVAGQSRSTPKNGGCMPSGVPGKCNI